MKNSKVFGVCSSTGVETLVSLLGDGQLHTVALGQGDVGLGALANHENVGQPENGRGKK